MKQKPFERLSDVLKRFRRLSYTTHVFATEQQVKHYGHARPEDLREMLLHELRFLKAQHEAFEKTWGKTFKQLETVLKRAKDKDLREHLAQVHEDLGIIRRSLFRSELAGWSDRELLDEWNEWERMKHYGQHDSIREGIRKERQELLRSELALRGHVLARRQATSSVEGRAETKRVETPQPTMEVVSKSDTDTQATAHVKAFEDWDDVYKEMVKKEVEYWQQALQQMEKEDAMGKHSLPLLKLHKHAQAEKRALRRRLGFQGASS